MTERWVPVVEFEGLYEVSDRGRVRSLVRHLPTKGGTIRPYGGVVLASCKRRGDYPGVSLCKDGKVTSRMVHILVCTAFHGPKPPDKDVVAHRDGDRQNARADNLRWATHKENEADKALHGTKLLGEATNNAKLTEFQVRHIKSRRASINALARRFGVCRSTIFDVLSGRTWAHVT